MAGGMLNVNREVTDSFYRYKMPRIFAKVEGKGNGIKTVIVNMVDIAKALGRPPSYPCKYFGCELGAQTNIDAKKERYIVNGSHDGLKLQDLLDGFIKKFVLCPGCDNPETVLVPMQKKKIISQYCLACCYDNPTIDMTHKLCTFILNHPPEMSESAAKLYAQKRRGNEDEDSPGDDAIDGMGVADSNGLSADVSVLGNATNELDYVADDDWSEDTSAAAVAQRQQDLSSGVMGMTITVDLEKTPLQRQELFFTFVENKRKSGALEDQSCFKEIYDYAVSLDITDKAPMILVGALFSENVVKELDQYKSLFARFLHVKTSKGTAEPNERAQRQFLGGLEMLVEKLSLIKKVPNILFKAYEIGFLSESVLKAWGEKPSKKFVPREVAKKINAEAKGFLDWLDNAESESDDEDEEDDADDGVVEFSTSTTAVIAAKAAENNVSNGDHVNGVTAGGDDDDIDIDDI